MNHKQLNKRISVSSVLLVFTVIILCVAILAVLSVSTARAEFNTANKYSNLVTEIYSLDDKGNQWVAQAKNEAEQSGRSSIDEKLSTVLLSENRQLEIELEITGGGDLPVNFNIVKWKNSAVTKDQDNLNLYK